MRTQIGKEVRIEPHDLDIDHNLNGCFIPTGGLLLTAGVDLGVDETGPIATIEIVAWGRNMESWSVGIVTAPLKGPADLIYLLKLINAEFSTEGGRILVIQGLGVDIGFQRDLGIELMLCAPSGVVFPMKGGKTGCMVRKAPHRVSGFRMRETAWAVDHALLKTDFMKSVKQGEDLRGWGKCHFPPYQQEVLEGLCSEMLVKRKDARGRPTLGFEVIGERNSSILEARCLALAAADICGVRTATSADWDEYSTRLKMDPGRRVSLPGKVERLYGPTPVTM